MITNIKIKVYANDGDRGLAGAGAGAPARKCFSQPFPCKYL